MEKQKPRSSTVIPLMKSTFSTRRQYILSDGEEISVRQILKKWPALRLSCVVSFVSYVLTCHNVLLIHFLKLFVSDGTRD